MNKTNKEGVYTRIKGNGEKVFIITYRYDNHFYKKTLGSTTQGWTLNKAVKERAKRIVDGEDTSIVIDIPKTFDQIAQEYFDSISHKPDYRNTMSRYHNHIQAKLGYKDISLITVNDVNKLKKYLTNVISKATGKPLALKTIDDRLNLIDTIYNYHNKVYYNNQIKSPANSKLVSRFNPDNARVRFLSKDEYHKLLKAIENRVEYCEWNSVHEYLSSEMLLYVKLLTTTGMRTYSALTLRARDFDFESNSINVQNHKTNRQYRAFIHPSIHDELKVLCNQIPSRNYLFGRREQPYHRTTINKRLLPIMNKLFNHGIEDRRERVVVHTLRHTFGSWLAQKGTSLYIISKLMDHSDVSQTQVYSKLASNSGEDSVISLDI